MNFKKQRLIDWSEKYFLPILFILLILAIATVAEAQDKVTVDRWRLEKACKELILLDSLTKDYSKKDSLISEMKSLITTLKSDIQNLSNIVAEKNIQVKNLYDSRALYDREIEVWKNAYAKEKWKRWNVSVGASVIYDLPDKQFTFGPGLSIGYSLAKF